MPDYQDPREDDIYAGDRRISRPDSSLPDWEVPDTAYRPIPIVWFTGALLTTVFVLGALFVILIDQSGWISIGITALATGVIGGWTWARGMGQASTGWKIATVIVLLAILAMYSLGAIDRL